ncbi:hypothetical protein PUN28_006694 [Cardiocondyla obscurior]|uniref:Uncharacterized protein n=1 Tax=Cardiocondyla obscurior TaxID=286306 RepID=A0AAW2G4H7_9HYME
MAIPLPQFLVFLLVIIKRRGRGRKFASGTLLEIVLSTCHNTLYTILSSSLKIFFIITSYQAPKRITVATPFLHAAVFQPHSAREKQNIYCINTIKSFISINIRTLIIIFKYMHNLT